MQIPIIIVHRGNQKYFQRCLEQTVKSNGNVNQIIVIGDNSNKNIINDFPNVQHVHYTSLHVGEDIEMLDKYCRF